MSTVSDVREQIQQRIQSLTLEQATAVLEFLDNLPDSDEQPQFGIRVLRGGAVSNAITDSFGRLGSGGFRANEPGWDDCYFAVEVADDPDQSVGFDEVYFRTFEQAQKVAFALSHQPDGASPGLTRRPRCVWLCEWGEWMPTGGGRTGDGRKGWLWVWRWDRGTDAVAAPQEFRYGQPIEGRKTPVAYQRPHAVHPHKSEV